MSEAVRETLCTNCTHRPVCSKKERYLQIVEALNGLAVYTDVESFTIESLDWIYIKDPECKYYMPKPTSYVRNIDCNESTSVY